MKKSIKIHECFFCNKRAVEEFPHLSTAYARNNYKKDRQRMLEEEGNIRVMAGRVGNKWVCYGCVEDLQYLLDKLVNSF